MEMPPRGGVILKGEKVVLRPTKMEEINLFYSWATKSDVSCFWYGEMYGNEPPTFERFVSSWGHYLDDSAPEKGRCWTIIVDEKPIGMISWDRIDFEERRTGIDIIIGSSENCGKGYGSDALKILTHFIFEKVGLEKIYIGAHIQNQRAIKAYRKAGFEETRITEEIKKDKFIKDYMGSSTFENSVLLVMKSGDVM